MDTVHNNLKQIALKIFNIKKSTEDIKKEEALLKLQIVSNENVSIYESLNSKRINLMTEIILCYDFNLDEAFKLSWYGQKIVDQIRELQYIKNNRG